MMSDAEICVPQGMNCNNFSDTLNYSHSAIIRSIFKFVLTLVYHQIPLRLQITLTSALAVLRVQSINN